MPNFNTTIDSVRTQQDVFDYLVDFSNVSEWDPSIPSAKRLDSGPIAVGSRFEIEFEMLGRTSELIYELAEMRSPERAVFHAENGTTKSVDTITVKPAGAGCKATYDADLTLKGPLKLVEPLVTPMFKRVSGKAASGLREKLRGSDHAAQNNS